MRPLLGLLLALPVLAQLDAEPGRAPSQDREAPQDPREEAEPQEEAWTSLFDGKTLSGWTQRNGTATYRVEDGTIVGRTTDGSPNSFLCTDRGYDDFELTFEVRVDDRLNSGVQIRSTTRDGFQGRVNGPQVEIEASGSRGAEAGYLYAEALGGWMTPKEQLKPHRTFQDGEWNRYLVRAEGANIKVWINGTQVSDLTHEEMYASHPRGFVGLQVHGIGRGQGPYEVAWRDLRIRELRTVAAGWRPSFDGESLAGWRTTGNWYWDEGELVIEPRAGERGWQRFDAYRILGVPCSPVGGSSSSSSSSSSSGSSSSIF